MHSLRHASAIWLLLLVASAASSHAQLAPAASSVDEQFAALHHQLTAVADQLASAGAPFKPAVGLSGVVSGAPFKPAVGLSGVVPEPAASTALARINQLRPLLEPILAEEGVPTTLTAVALVESGGRATALSSKGALGLWQLMPQTARRFGLTVTAATDERLDTVKSTRAAARYLRELQQRFGNWQLAFAAYNAGEQTVERALRHSGSADFLQLSAHLPAETRAYVPAVRSAISRFEREQPLTSPPGAARSAPVVFALAGSAD